MWSTCKVKNDQHVNLTSRKKDKTASRKRGGQKGGGGQNINTTETVNLRHHLEMNQCTSQCSTKAHKSLPSQDSSIKPKARSQSPAQTQQQNKLQDKKHKKHAQ